MDGHNEPAGGQPLLTREILTLAAVVVLGAIMTILDATIVNVALPTLGRDFRTSIVDHPVGADDLPAGLRHRDPRVRVGDRAVRRPAGLDRLARAVPGRLAGLRAVRVGRPS